MLRRCGGRSEHGDDDDDEPVAAIHPPFCCELQTAPEPGRKRARREQEAAPVAGGGRGGGGSLPCLPLELVSNILSRLPVRVLSRCRSVCRTWHALITDPRFVAEHMDRSKAERSCLLIYPFKGAPRHHPSEPNRTIGLFACGLAGTPSTAPLLFEANDEIPISENAPDEEPVAMHVCHCDGLVLFTTECHVYVCNPSTGEFVCLPMGKRVRLPIINPSTAKVTLGRDPATGEYKLVKCFYRFCNTKQRTSRLGCEVLTLGRRPGALSWKATSDDPPYPVRVDYATVVDGIVYWKIDNRLHSLRPEAILSFDFRDEKFSTVRPPSSFWPYDAVSMDSKTTLQGMGEKLCFIYIQYDKRLFDIWMLNDRAHHIWTKEYSIQLPSQYRPKFFLELHLGGILFITGQALCYYDFETKTVEERMKGFEIVLRHPQLGSFMINPDGGHCQDAAFLCQERTLKLPPSLPRTEPLSAMKETFKPPSHLHKLSAPPACYHLFVLQLFSAPATKLDKACMDMWEVLFTLHLGYWE